MFESKIAAVREQPARTGHRLISEAQWRALRSKLRLAPREVEVVQGVFDDRKEADLARRIGVSAPTVHTYLRRLYRKLGVSSRAALVVRVFATHLELLREE